MMGFRVLFFFLTVFFSTQTFAGEPGWEPYYAPRQPASTPPRYNPAPPPAPAPYQPPARDNFFTLWGDFFFGTAPEDGLSYVLDCTGALIGCGAQEVEAKFDPGFRVAAGYTWASDMWDVRGRWTWFKNDGKHFTGTPPTADGTLYPVWIHPNNAGTPTTANSHWSMLFNTVDLEIGKTFNASQWVTFRPHSGLKAAFIDQDFSAQYLGGSFAAVPSGRVVSIENDFWGVGIRGGFDTLMDIGSGFGLIGKAAGSVLWGQFEINNHETFGAQTSVNVGDRFETTRAALEGGLGLNFHTTFLGENLPIDFHTMWEMQMWFSQNMMKRFVDPTADGVFLDTRGDLGLHGVTLGMSISF